ncbi:hypothetical protein Tco_0097300 [Tanacetum coccineum]
MNAKKTIPKVAMEANETMEVKDDVVNTEEQPKHDVAPKQDNSTWFKNDARPETPDPKWHKVPNVDDAWEQTWFHELVNVDKNPLTFDDLIGSTVDFTNFAMHRLKEDKITKADLEGPAYNLLKGTCRNNIKLEYNLEYKERKYASSLTKTKAARYDLVGIKEMIPRLWSSLKEPYDKNDKLGIHHWGPKCQLFYRSRNAATSRHEVLSRADQKEYTFKEADFSRLHLNDIEDMFLLYIQHKLHNLAGDDIVDLMISLRMFTRSIIIKRRVEDVQLGVESYQQKLNITRPQTTFDGISFKEPFTTVYKPKGVVYLNKSNRKRLMQADKLYKFSDDTLKSVHDTLHEMLQNFVLGYNHVMPKKAWTEKDQKRTDKIVQMIDNLLLERQIMRSLECFIGGRTVETDYKLLMWAV